MMKSLGVLLGSFLLAGSLSAAQEDVLVANIKALKGQVLVEDAAGQRTVANTATKLMEGSNLIILEKAEVELEYVASQCNIVHPGNTLLQVSESTQCAAGQQIGVGFTTGGGASLAAGGGLVAGIIGIVVVVAVGSSGGNDPDPASR